MNFGNVNVGSSKNLTGTLSAGGADVTVSSANWSGLGYSVSGITFPVTILAGKTKTFTVTFAPQTTGTSNGQVSFVSDATNSPTVETFTGTGSQASQHSVTLTWDASTSPVVGYYIYRRTSSGSYGAPLNPTPQAALTFDDDTVANATTYFYEVRAVDSDSQLSVPSNEVTAVIP
jgi:fibronectin type 3 domain-containing protein